MKSDDKKFIACIGVIAVVFIGGYAGLIFTTGLNSPFSVIMSESMQHDNEHSELGIIDTGDVVIVKNKDRAEIQSYIEGTYTGYSTFGDYGSVIIYNRGSASNPVIHRAILWLDYNVTTNTWSAPTLEKYQGMWYWTYNNIESTETQGIRGVLCFENLTQSGKDVSINLETLEEKKSGFLTMGDNIHNRSFDQGTSIVSHTIDMDDIRSVPFMEIPWIGAIKILFKNESKLNCVTNSIPSLAMLFIIVVSLFIIIDLFGIRHDKSIIIRTKMKFRKI